jgi:kinesin family protein 22
VLCTFCATRYRIIEIEWSVKNNREFVPSPKPPRKTKGKKKPKNNKEQLLSDDAPMDVDQDCDMKSTGSRRGATEFGLELTNTDSPKGGGSKRPLDDEDNESTETPPKRQKRGGKLKVLAMDDSGEDEWMPPAPSKGKRKMVS